jgi:lipopolysaccharide/colanic/teichoic acid biosynthesis glycosyltransferase
VHGVGAVVKRVVDVAGALFGLTVFAVPMAIIAAAIKLDSKGPVFFLQERVGRHGRPFRIVKFRTMVPGAVTLPGGLTTWRGDPRVTRVGRLLRDKGLDELPQFLNVLAGDLSLVGPRPTVPSQVAKYDDRQRRRLDVRPGMTSMPVIVARNRLPWREKIELDLHYIERWSLWLDVKIMVATVWVALSTREGEFKGDLERDSVGKARS